MHASCISTWVLSVCLIDEVEPIFRFCSDHCFRYACGGRGEFWTRGAADFVGELSQLSWSRRGASKGKAAPGYPGRCIKIRDRAGERGGE